MEEGMRFSLLYLERSAPVKDSERFRNRLAAYYMDNLYPDVESKIKSKIIQETGAEIPYIVTKFFKKMNAETFSTP